MPKSIWRENHNVHIAHIGLVVIVINWQSGSATQRGYWLIKVNGTKLVARPTDIDAAQRAALIAADKALIETLALVREALEEHSE